MCGIAGSINIKLDEKRLINNLLHRGPDGQKIYKNNNITLFHSRLSIQDLSTNGTQPMEFENLIIVFNGEIYNHLWLRES